MLGVDAALTQAVSQARSRGIEYSPEQVAQVRQRLQAKYGASEEGGSATAAPRAGVSDTTRIVVRTAQRHGVDPILVSSLINQESGGRHYDENGSVLTSPAGARGLMQLMPGTAQGLGVDPDDLEQNIDGGVRYLKQQLDTFHGDIPKALAAYNAGPGAVERYRGVPPYHETVNYVRNVVSRYNRFANAGGDGSAAAPAVEAGTPAVAGAAPAVSQRPQAQGEVVMPAWVGEMAAQAPPVGTSSPIAMPATTPVVDSRGESTSSANPREQVGITPLPPMRETAGQGPVGLNEYIDRMRVEEKLPFVGSVFVGNRLLDMYRAAEAYNAGTASEKQTNMVLDMVAEQQRGTTIAADVANIVSELPGIAVEFAATLGLVSAGRAAATRAAKKLVSESIQSAITRAAASGAARSLAGRAATTTVGLMARAGAQAILSPQRVYASYARRLQPEISEDEANEFGIKLTMSDEPFIEALTKAYGDVAIEYFSESTGEYLNPMRLQRLNALKQAVVSRWVSRFPNSSVRDLTARIASASGWHGMLGEIAEERVGEALRGATGIEEYRLPTFRQLVTEAIAFSVPGTGAAAADIFSNRRPAGRSASQPPPPPAAPGAAGQAEIPSPVTPAAPGAAAVTDLRTAPVTDEQRIALREIGHQDVEIDGMNRAEAGAIITRQMDQPTAHTVQNQTEFENLQPPVSRIATPEADGQYNQAGITENSAQTPAQQVLTAEDRAAINAITSPEMLAATRADALARGDAGFAAAIDARVAQLRQRQSDKEEYRRISAEFSDDEAAYDAAASAAVMRQHIADRISAWLSPDKLKTARGKTRNEIFAMFGNTLEQVGVVPESYLGYFGQNVKDNRVYSGAGYFIDHAVNHHDNISPEHYQRIPEILQSADEVILDNRNPKDVSLVFVKRYGRNNAVVVALGKGEHNQLVLHKSYFSQSREIYPKLKRLPPADGVSAISRASETAPGSSLPALGGTAIVPQTGEKSRPFNSERGEISMELLIPPPVARAVAAIRDGIGDVYQNTLTLAREARKRGMRTLNQFYEQVRAWVGEMWPKVAPYLVRAWNAVKDMPVGLSIKTVNADGSPMTQEQLRAAQEIAKRQQRLEERALGRIDPENATLAEYEDAIREVRQQVAGKEGETAARVAQVAARQAEKSAAFAKGALAAAPQASPAIRKRAAAIIASERNAKKAGNEVAEHLLTTMMETHRQEQENVGKAIAAARKRVDPEHLGKVLNDVARANTLEKVADLAAKAERVQQHADQRQEAQKIVDTFKKTVAKISAGKLKAIDPQYQLRIRDLLSQFDLKAGFRGLSEAKEHDLRSLLTVINKNGIPFGINKATLRELERLNKRSLGEMTHDEMVFLHQNFQQIMALGELKKQLRARQVEHIRQAELGKLLAGTKNMDYLNPDSPKLEERTNWIKRQAADLSFGLRYTDALDGGKKYQGENTRMLRQLGEAVNRGEMEANTIFVETLDKLKAIDPELSIDTETSEQRKFWAKITFHLMADNQLWQQAQAVIGYYDLTEEETLTRTPQQQRIIEALRGAFNGIGPRVRAVEMEIHGELFGLNPKYFPLKYRDYSPYDTKLTGTQASFYDRLRESIGQTVPKQQTPFSGFTFGRIPGVKKVPRIDLIGVMYEGLGEQLHYVNTEPVLFRTKHLVLSEEYHQQAGSNAINWWTEQLNIIAQRGRTENYQGNKIIQWLRGNVSRAILHFKASTILLQPTASFDAIALATSLYGEKAGRQVAAEVARAFASPKATDEFIAQHPDLTLRRGMAGEDIMREINTERSSRGEKPSLGGRMISFGDIITAAGAQRAFVRILAENGAKDPAAEAALLMSVANSTNNYAYRPQILSRGDLQKALLMFQSFGLNRAQLIIDDIINKGVVQSARRGEWSKALTSSYALIQMEIGIVLEIVVRKGIKAGIGALVGLGLAAAGLDAGDDDDREWMNLDNFVKANISTVPWFGDIINSAYDAGVKGYARDVDNPIVRLINNLARGLFFMGKVAFGEKEQTNRRIAMGMIDLLEDGAALAGVAGTIQMGEVARSIARQALPARDESPRKAAREAIMEGLRAGRPMTAEIAAAREAGYISRSTKPAALRAEAMQPEPVRQVKEMDIEHAMDYWSQADEATRRQVAEEVSLKLQRAQLSPERRAKYIEQMGSYYRPRATERFQGTGGRFGGANRFGGGRIGDGSRNRFSPAGRKTGEGD